MTDADIAADLRHVIKHLRGELKAVEARAGKPPTPDPITDHAIVRYMERVKGVDMRRLRAEILTDDRHALLAAGLGRIKGKGYDLICSKGVVITVAV